MSGGAALTTNNRMELMAAISALEALKVESAIVVVTDSAYVKNGITEWLNGWKRERLEDGGRVRGEERRSVAAARCRGGPAPRHLALDQGPRRTCGERTCRCAGAGRKWRRSRAERTDFTDACVLGGPTSRRVSPKPGADRQMAPRQVRSAQSVGQGPRPAGCRRHRRGRRPSRCARVTETAPVPQAMVRPSSRSPGAPAPVAIWLPRSFRRSFLARHQARGERPRIRRSTVSAGKVQSMRVSVLSIFAA